MTEQKAPDFVWVGLLNHEEKEIRCCTYKRQQVHVRTLFDAGDDGIQLTFFKPCLWKAGTLGGIAFWLHPALGEPFKVHLFGEANPALPPNEHLAIVIGKELLQRHPHNPIVPEFTAEEIVALQFADLFGVGYGKDSA